MAFEQQRVVLDFGGTDLVGALTIPSGATKCAALLLHGGPGGAKEGPSDLYVRLANAIAHVGIASARFDFLGEGESGGDYAMTSADQQVSQCKTINRWLRSTGYEHVALVGESFGATAALGAYEAMDVEALVLLWPAIWLLDGTFAPLIPEDWESRLQQFGAIDVEGKNVGRSFVEGLFAHSDRENELRKVAVPTLLIHGDADSEVPVMQSHKAHVLLNDPKRLVVVPNAGHCLRRPNEQEVVIRETTAWLKTYLARSAK